MHFWLDSTLNAYGQIFFTRHRIASWLIIAVTFLYWPAGLAGLLSVVLTHGIALALGYAREQVLDGLWGMNGLLVTLALASVYELDLTLIIVLSVSVVFTLLWSIVLTHSLGRVGLPALSAPFILSTWAVLLASRQFAALSNSEYGIFTLNELYRIGGSHLVGWYQALEQWALPEWLDLWLRSLAAIVFQENLVAGILLTCAIWIASRISLLMSLSGFLAGYLFYTLVGGDMAQLQYSYIGFNFILTAIALGAFFFIPSWRTFLLVIVIAPVISMAIAATSAVCAILYLPVYSVPFVILVLTVLYATWFITHTQVLPRPAVQSYVPEHNLYNWRNYLARFGNAVWTHIYLPFMGEWQVSQAHDGPYTHRGHWRHAWDFVVRDEQGRTFRNQGTRLEDYYCYNLPITAPADGYVVEVVDHVPDNEPGQVNLQQSWGNAVVIRHAEGLYSNLAHLREGTILVKVGDFVHKGQTIARLGNSGRSPEPHLHFQLQATPWVGSRTLLFPLAAYISLQPNGQPHLHMYDYPKEGQVVGNIEPHLLLRKAFGLQPGQILRFGLQGHDKETPQIVEWEVRTSTAGKTYIECLHTQSRIWFYQDEVLFYCTAFEGDKDTLLYAFYLGAYKVVLGLYAQLEIHDTIPLHQIEEGPSRWLHDLVAPFIQLSRVHFFMHYPDKQQRDQIRLHSKVIVKKWRSKKQCADTTLVLDKQGLHALQYTDVYGKKWEATRIPPPVRMSKTQPT